MLKEWLADLAPNEPLFPKLANRRTWLMVKLDLKAAGIPYRTKDDVADFHAAGRHTYITELLRNGTSLVEARELARHADVKMTMNYTHIGLRQFKTCPPTRSGCKCAASRASQRVTCSHPTTRVVTRMLRGVVTQALVRCHLQAHRDKKRHRLSQTVPSGGGGNRTRVP